MKLYRGVGFSSELVKPEYYKIGYTVQTTSFTSSSMNLIESVNFAISGLVFEINAIRNPKNISILSFVPKEQELLFPPATRFKVTDNQYQYFLLQCC